MGPPIPDYTLSKCRLFKVCGRSQFPQKLISSSLNELRNTMHPFRLNQRYANGFEKHFLRATCSSMKLKSSANIITIGIYARSWLDLTFSVFRDFGLHANILGGRHGLHRICDDCPPSRGFETSCQLWISSLTKDLMAADAAILWRSTTLTRVLKSTWLECVSSLLCLVWIRVECVCLVLCSTAESGGLIHCRM